MSPRSCRSSVPHSFPYSSGLEQNRPEAILFSLINFCYAMLNLDITLVAVVPDMHLALKVSRLDHFFLSLIMLGVNLHLIYLVTE